MPDIDLKPRLERALAAIHPGAQLISVSPLLGGNSASVQLCDVELHDGEKKRIVARTPSDYRRSQHADAAWREFSIIQSMHGVGIPVQKPLWLEPLTADNPAPFYLVEYCEGRPELGPANVTDYFTQYATQLARVHQLNWRGAKLSFLREVGDGSPKTRAVKATRMNVGEIRAALLTLPRQVDANPAVLCHGDFWPGNLLWRDGKLFAIIDWEEAVIGEPLFDLAICRLDLLWIVGEAAVEKFTHLYQSLTGFNLANLPYWDLLASLRPINGVEDWAKSYPHLGRADVTAETMIRDHGAYVARALARWPAQD